MSDWIPLTAQEIAQVDWDEVPAEERREEDWPDSPGYVLPRRPTVPSRFVAWELYQHHLPKRESRRWLDEINRKYEHSRLLRAAGVNFDSPYTIWDFDHSYFPGWVRRALRECDVRV
jgi:hypothetical protein